MCYGTTMNMSISQAWRKKLCFLLWWMGVAAAIEKDWILFSHDQAFGNIVTEEALESFTSRDQALLWVLLSAKTCPLIHTQAESLFHYFPHRKLIIYGYQYVI